MNLIVNAADLTPALKLAASVATNRDGGTACVQLHAGVAGLSVRATDYDAACSVAVPADVADAGVALVNARAIAATVAALPPAATVGLRAMDNLRLEITAGRSRYTLAAMPEDEAPEVTLPLCQTELPAGWLAALGQVAPTVSQDESRPATACVMWNGEAMVATDGHRLHARQLGQPKTGAVLLHRRGLSLLSAIAPTHYALEGSAATFAAGTTRVQVRRVDATFPDYTKVVPDTTGSDYRSGTVNAAALVDAMRMVSAVQGKGDVPILKLAAIGGALLLDIDSPNGDSGHTEVEADDWPLMPTFGVHPRYLAEAIRAAGGEFVRIHWLDQFSPLVVDDPANGAFVAVCMPCRL